MENNRKMRIDYDDIKENMKDWVKEDDDKLKSGKFGVEFENVIRDLEENKIFLRSEE